MKSIRPAVFHELPLVRDLALHIWPHAYGDILTPDQLTYMLDKIYSLPSLQHQFSDLNHSFIFIVDNNIPVGFATFSPKDGDNSVYRLHKIYVMPQQQGGGTGKMLLQYIISFAKNAEAQMLELSVNRYNKARYFYEKQGFIIASEVDIDIGEGYFMNDFIMQLKLK